MEQNELRSLLTIRSGQKVRLARINAGRDLHSRLIAMGLVPNTEITVVRNHHLGPFVIMVKNSRMVLGRGMAHKIMVSACDYEENKSRPGGQS
jgi:ferrous iron transport protein A